MNTNGEMTHIQATLLHLRTEAQRLNELANDLERVFRLAPAIAPAPEPPPKPAAPRPKKARAPKADGITSQLRMVIPSLDEPFSVNNVIEVLDQELSLPQIACLRASMRHMANTGELTEVEKGKPGKPSTFRRALQITSHL